jgi:hypothetical protein
MIRLLTGALALVSVWFGVVEYEEFRRRPLIFVGLGLLALMLSAVGSLASNALGRKPIHAVAFALPFVVPAGMSALAVRDRIFSPFLFWIGAAVAALILALVTDRLVPSTARRVWNAWRHRPSCSPWRLQRRSNLIGDDVCSVFTLHRCTCWRR